MKMTLGRRLGGVVFGLAASACAAPGPAGAGHAQIPSPPAHSTSPSRTPVSVAESSPPIAERQPPLDSDSDGIPDDRDLCPQEPENYNGCNDDDGCPDRFVEGSNAVLFHISDRIYFGRGRSDIASNLSSLLDAVATTINANPAVGIVEVEGHSASNERHADRVAAARAAEVVVRLMDRGVARDRLAEHAYGARRPVCTQSNEACFLKNRRVEFSIPHPPPPPPPPTLPPGDCWSRLL